MRGPLDRTSPPPPAALRPFEFPAVDRTTLPGGLELRIAVQDRVPLVTTVVVLDAGESVLPGNRAGLAGLTADALTGGTLDRDGDALAEALEQLGARFGAGAGWHSTTLSLTHHADRLEEAWTLLEEILRFPAFPGPEVDRVRAQRGAALRQRRSSPGALAADALDRVVFGDRHPYGRPVEGTAPGVESFGPDAARRWHGLRYRPGGAGFVVVGDVDPDRAHRRAADLEAGWVLDVPDSPSDGDAGPAGTGAGGPGDPGGGAGPGGSASPPARIVVVDRPGSVQSEIRLGSVGVARNDPRFFDLMVLNTLLGGAFTSRLNLNLRERNGFTYGVRSRFAFRRWPGPFTVSAAVGTEVTGAAIGEALGEIRRLLRDGPTPEEVAAARDYLAGIFPLQLETSDRVASRLAELHAYGLPDDYFATYRDRLRAVTEESAWAAGREVLDPDALHVAVAGDGEALRKDLTALGHGAVEVWNPDDVAPKEADFSG